MMRDEGSAAAKARVGRAARRLTAVLCALALALCTSAAAQEAPVVRTVTVLGAQLIPTGVVLRYLDVEEGGPLDRAALAAAVEQLKRTGMFSEARAQVAPLEGGGVEVRVTVVEWVRVTELNFRGNRRIGSDRLRALVDIAPPQEVGASRVQTARASIISAYAKAGRPLTRVDASVEARAPGEFVLLFDVLEGPKTFVRRIEVTGNTVFTAKQIRKAMRSRPRGWPGFLRPGRFNEETFQDDQWQIGKKYYDAGYLDVKVGGHRSFSPDLRKTVLHVTIYEGSTYTVSGIEFEGNSLYRDDELLRAIPLKAGRPLLPPELEQSKDIIASMYGDQGYVDVGAPGRATLVGEPVFGEEGRAAVVRFRIKEGVQVTVRRVRIEGLTRTRDDVARRELALHPGDRASTSKVNESVRRLRATGHYDLQDPNSVAITFEPDEGPLRDAVVRVKEGHTGLVILGAGVSTDGGVLANITLTEDNFDIGNLPRSWADLFRGNAFRGGGQRLALELALGNEQSSVSLAFQEPSLGGGPLGLGLRAYSRTATWDEFELRRSGGAVSLVRRLNPWARAEAGVSFEQVRMYDVDDTAPFEIARDEGSYSKPSVFAAYTIDRRDNPFVPSTGYLLSLQAEVAALDIETIRLVAEAEGYWTVLEPKNWGKHILTVRGKAGVLWSYTGNRIPVFERFYAGGAGSLRGFEAHGVSPVEPTQNKQVGGESILLGSMEYSVPVIRDDLRLAAFVDGGYVCQDAQDLLTGWDELRVAVGLGLRWRIHFLGQTELTVDFGVPIMKQTGDETQPFSFSFGATRRF